MPAVLFAQALHLSPVVFAMHRSSGDWWHPDNKPISYAGAGFIAQMDRGNWTFRSEFVNSRYFGIADTPNRFSPEQGLSWRQHGSLEKFEIDTDYTKMLVMYEAEEFAIRAGKYDLSWGPAGESIALSSKPPALPRVGFDWQVFPWLTFRYNHAQLKSGQIDSAVSFTATSFSGDRNLLLSRYLVAHRLEVSLPLGVKLGVAESVIYGDRGIDMVYLMPFISYWSAQHFLGDLDNTQLTLDISWDQSTGLNFYGILLVDEWRPQWTFKNKNRNWFGWQYGASGENLLQEGDHFRVESTWTDHRIYRHRFPVNNYDSHGSPLGSWIGPHAELLSLLYRLPIRDGFGQIRMLRAKRGELTEQMITDQYDDVPYERFSGASEALSSIRMSMFLPTFGESWLEFSTTYIEWENPRFDPTSPAKMPNSAISKWSFNLGFYKNFSLQGYDVSDIIR